jgi:hypothetical protein
MNSEVPGPIGPGEEGSAHALGDQDGLIRRDNLGRIVDGDGHPAAQHDDEDIALRVDMLPHPFAGRPGDDVRVQIAGNERCDHPTPVDGEIDRHTGFPAHCASWSGFRPTTLESPTGSSDTLRASDPR